MAPVRWNPSSAIASVAMHGAAATQARHRALIDKGFTELGVQRVYAETMAVNVGSRRVMEKAGLRFVRNFRAEWPVRVRGDQEGDVEYAITRAEWEADRAAGGPRTTP